jgi:hypothetical protein
MCRQLSKINRALTSTCNTSEWKGRWHYSIFEYPQDIDLLAQCAGAKPLSFDLLILWTSSFDLLIGSQIIGAVVCWLIDLLERLRWTMLVKSDKLLLIYNFQIIGWIPLLQLGGSRFVQCSTKIPYDLIERMWSLVELKWSIVCQAKALNSFLIYNLF